MSEANLILLLQLIYSSGEVNSLLQRGLHFSQIATLMSFAEDNGYITEEENRLKLTALGVEKMRTSQSSNKIRKDGGWVSPLEEYRIEKLQINEVYLPDYKTIISLLKQGH